MTFTARKDYLIINRFEGAPVEKLPVEIVERKGIGHPDSIADGIADEYCKLLCKYYYSKVGTILHHNVDKVLVVGGEVKVTWGGGEVLKPIFIMISGRATYSTVDWRERKEEKYAIGSLALRAAREWFKRNIRHIDVYDHIIVDYRIGMGAVELRELVETSKSAPLANDTSLGVSYAPLSRLERLVLEAERLLNSPKVKEEEPAIGEDIKVMGVRIGDKVKVTVAAAIVSKYVNNEREYFKVKDAIRKYVEELCDEIGFKEYKVYVNTADRPEYKRYYLTVTGTSAEQGDDGMTGRGNRVNGLITPCRPMSIEAAAGKNPVSHVGKVYNVLARIIAENIVKEVEDVCETYVLMLSQIGKPINEPMVVNVQLVPREGKNISENVKSEVQGIIDKFLNPKMIESIRDKLIEGEITVF